MTRKVRPLDPHESSALLQAQFETWADKASNTVWIRTVGLYDNPHGPYLTPTAPIIHEQRSIKGSVFCSCWGILNCPHSLSELIRK